MAERSPLFLGLARPPKYLGLPVGYLVVLATGVVLPFIWTKSMVFFLIGIVAYPILWFVADREPHFFEVLRVSYGSVRATKNRALHGGDPRFGLPDREAIEDVEMDDLRTWLAEHLRLGELEITVVGDLDVEDTITHAAQTFGLLEMRQDLGDFDERRSVPATAPT